jgi:2-iminobutanoate/2-iminopropanoate deaminase
MQRRDLNAPDAPLPVAAYTQAIEVSGAARTLYISGQVGLRMDGTIPTTSSSRAASLGKISKCSSRLPA